MPLVKKESGNAYRFLTASEAYDEKERQILPGCIWLETKFAKAQGASDAEVAEAVAQAAYVRHWSTVINSLQIDFDTFKSEFGGD